MSSLFEKCGERGDFVLAAGWFERPRVSTNCLSGNSTVDVHSSGSDQRACSELAALTSSLQGLDDAAVAPGYDGGIIVLLLLRRRALGAAG